MPGGVLVTVPAPVPARVTLRVKVVGAAAVMLSVVLPVTALPPTSVALMTVVPTATTLASPVLLIVAVAGVPLDQVISGGVKASTIACWFPPTIIPPAA